MSYRGIMRIAGVALCAAVVGLAPGSSRADNDSILTVGVGAGIGYRHAAGPGETAGMEFINQANVRIKMLWILGLDFSVDLAKDTKLTEADASKLHYAAKMRATALFYPIPTSVFELYLGAGLGAGKTEEFFSGTSPGNSYHIGGGFEVHLNDHFTIDASFYMVVPGYASLKNHVEQLAYQIADQTAQDVANGTTPPPTSIGDIPLPDVTVGDYITPTNYELMIRIFLFL